MVIEDSLSGLQAGKNAGIEVLNIPDLSSLAYQTEIDSITDYKLNNLKELLKIVKKM